MDKRGTFFQGIFRCKYSWKFLVFHLDKIDCLFSDIRVYSGNGSYLIAKLPDFVLFQCEIISYEPNPDLRGVVTCNDRMNSG